MGKQRITWGYLICIIFCSVYVNAQVIQVLEDGYYAEEVQGDLNLALSLYQQAEAQAGGDTASLAKALAHQGVVLAKMGHKKDALRIFEKLKREHPNQLQHLLFIQEYYDFVRGAGLVLESPQWQNGVMRRYAMYGPNGEPFGVVDHTLRPGEKENSPVWYMEYFFSAPLVGTLNYAGITARQEDMMALTTTVRSTIWGAKDITYQNNLIQVKGSVSGRHLDSEVKHDGAVYDVDELPFLVARFPLAEGYEISLPVFNGFLGRMVNSHIKVLSKEPYKNKAWSGDAWKINIDHQGAQGTLYTDVYWVSSDQEKLLLKVETPQGVVELHDVLPHYFNQKNKEFVNKEYNIKLPNTEGWHFFTFDHPSAYVDFASTLISAQSMGDLTATRLTKEYRAEATLDVIFNDDYPAASFIGKNYSVREESKTYMTINGIPALRFVADYTLRGQPMIAYRTYYLGENTGYSIRFMIFPEDFEKVKPELDLFFEAAIFK